MKKPCKSWPIGLTVYYCFFVGAVIFAGVALSLKKFDLVTPDYYAEELAYQDRIDSLARVAGLKQKPTVSVKDYQTVVLEIPEALLTRIEAGSLVLYRPADASLDHQVAVEKDVGSQSVVLPVPARGLWSARLSWTMEGEVYYLEESLVFPEMETAGP